MYWQWYQMLDESWLDVVCVKHIFIERPINFFVEEWFRKSLFVSLYICIRLCLPMGSFKWGGLSWNKIVFRVVRGYALIPLSLNKLNIVGIFPYRNVQPRWERSYISAGWIQSHITDNVSMHKNREWCGLTRFGTCVWLEHISAMVNHRNDQCPERKREAMIWN